MRGSQYFLLAVLLASCSGDPSDPGGKKKELRGVTDKCGITAATLVSPMQPLNGFDGNYVSWYALEPARQGWYPLEVGVSTASDDVANQRSGVAANAGCEAVSNTLTNSRENRALKVESRPEMRFRFPALSFATDPAAIPDEPVTLDAQAVGTLTFKFVEPIPGEVGEKIVREQTFVLQMECKQPFRITRSWDKPPRPEDKGFCKQRDGQTVCLNYRVTDLGKDCEFNTGSEKFHPLEGGAFDVKLAGELKKGWVDAQRPKGPKDFSLIFSHIEME